MTGTQCWEGEEQQEEEEEETVKEMSSSRTGNARIVSLDLHERPLRVSKQRSNVIRAVFQGEWGSTECFSTCGMNGNDVPVTDVSKSQRSVG